MRRFMILTLVLVAFLPPQSPAIADASLDSASSMLLGSRYKEAICEYEKIIYSKIDSGLSNRSFASEKYKRAMAISDLILILLRSQTAEQSLYQPLEDAGYGKRRRKDSSISLTCFQHKATNHQNVRPAKRSHHLHPPLSHQQLQSHCSTHSSH